MKILVITQKVDENDDILGFFCGWLNELAKKIEKIYVLTLEKQNTDLAKNIELYSMGKERGSSRVRRFLKFNQIAAKLLLERKVDIAFIHMCPEYAILAWPYAKLKNIPMVIWYAHGGVNMHLRIAHFLVNRVVSSSKDGFRINNSRKLTVIGQGIDLEKFKSYVLDPEPKNGKKIILSVGRISPIKNYETLIRAVDILVNQKNFRNLNFRVIGSTPLRSQKSYLHFLKDRVIRYNLGDYIQFVGPIPYTQIHNYYQNCDLFVSASNTGSLDKSTLEAMACGRIVLTCNEAFKDILGNHSKNLMFRKGNSTELVEKINSLLQMDKGLQSELGIDLRNIVIEEHNLRSLIDKLASIFQGAK